MYSFQDISEPNIHPIIAEKCVITGPISKYSIMTTFGLTDMKENGISHHLCDARIFTWAKNWF